MRLTRGTVSEPAARVVTIVLTDVEGSTRLWQDDASRMLASIERHHALVDTLVARHGGHLPPDQGEGDSRMAVFGGVLPALHFGRELLAALAETPSAQPTHFALRVRIGVHTGPAIERDGNYFGPTVNRAARVRSAAHGGQVLVSAEASGAARDIPDGWRFEDLGAHRLKDLAEPVRLLQLVAPGLQQDFAPPNTLDRYRHNLPVRASPLVGRDHDLAALVHTITDPSTRIVTLAGPGGVGKTAVALQAAADAADDFPDGLWFVDLSGVSSPAHVPHAVAAALLEATDSADPAAAIAAFLLGRRCLVVLDNFEHVIEAGSFAVELVGVCPSATVLTTSREPLMVSGEHVVAVEPLAIGGAARDLFHVAAAAAGHPVDAGLAAVVDGICDRLDGLPLAIEIAASRLSTSSPADLLRRLDDGLAVLTSRRRDTPSRHRTMTAVVEWSYELLDTEERAALQALAVFRGGFEREAAATVIGAPDADPLVEALADRSLVRRPDLASPRLALLETVRSFAEGRLAASGRREDIAGRHLAWCVAFAAGTYHDLDSPRAAGAARAFDADYDNIRAALEWASVRAPDRALELAGWTGRYWVRRGLVAEGRRWLERLQPFDGAVDSVRTRVLNLAGVLATRQGDFAEALRFLDEALDARRSAGDATGEAEVLTNLGAAMHRLGEPAHATDAFVRAGEIFARLADDRGVARSELNLGAVARLAGRADGARVHYGRAAALFRSVDDRAGLAAVLSNLGALDFSEGRDDSARASLEESLTLCRDLGDRAREADVLYNLGKVEQMSGGDPEVAMAMWEESVRLAGEVGDLRSLAVTSREVGGMALERREAARAAGLLALALDAAAALGDSDEVLRAAHGIGECALLIRPGDGAGEDLVSRAARAEPATPPPGDLIELARSLAARLTATPPA